MKEEKLLEKLNSLKDRFSLLSTSEQVEINFRNLCNTAKNSLKSVIGDSYNKEFETYCRIEGYTHAGMEFQEVKVIEAYWRLSTVDKRVINPSAYTLAFLTKKQRSIADNMLNMLNIYINTLWILHRSRRTMFKQV